MPPNQKDEVLRIRIESALKAEVEAMAAEMGESTSVIVRQLLRNLVAERKQKAKDSIVTNPLPSRVPIVEPASNAEDD